MRTQSPLSRSETRFLHTLYQSYAGPLYRVAHHRLGDPYLAQDLVQTVFLAAAEKLPTLRRHENPWAWLLRALHYELSHTYTKLARERQRLCPLDQAEATTSAPPPTLGLAAATQAPAADIELPDGQIVLETELFHAGIMPAVNPGISVSRVGGNAQIKAMKKVAGSLKLLYSQYRELQGFAQFGSDLDADTKARLAQGARIVEVLKQNRNHPIAVEDQVCIFYAVTHDFLKDVQVQDVAEYEEGLYARMAAQHNDVLDAIRTTGQLSAETEAALKAALTDYTRDFLKTKA